MATSEKKKKTKKTTAMTEPDALREAVLAAHGGDDEATLQVWSDALIERGDPRGELIRLQLQRASQENDKLVDAHVRKHARALLGDLGSVLMLNRHVVFDRGFLINCAIATDSRSKLAKVIGHPDWATVRSIYFHDFSGGSLAPEEETEPHPVLPVLLHPVLANVRSLLEIGLCDVFPALCQSPHPLGLEHVMLMDFEDDEIGEDQKTAIMRSTSVPRLRSLGMGSLPPTFLFKTQWAKQVELVELHIPHQRVDEAISMLERAAPHVSTLVLRPNPSVGEPEWQSSEWLFTIERPSRGARFSSVRVTKHGLGSELPGQQSYLNALPSRLKRH